MAVHSTLSLGVTPGVLLEFGIRSRRLNLDFRIRATKVPTWLPIGLFDVSLQTHPPDAAKATARIANR
jgi:hypothetical protein